MPETKKPRGQTSESEKELARLEKQFEEQKEQIEALTKDRMDKAPKLEEEPQTKLSQKDIENSKDIYLKPEKSISSPEKFNEKFREDYDHKKQYVRFVAENKELVGETIELWTKRFPGVPAQYWKVPVNKPVWGPRFLAEQISKQCYHRLVMDESVQTAQDGMGTYHGQIVVDKTVQRLDAQPVVDRKSIFMGAREF